MKRQYSRMLYTFLPVLVLSIIISCSSGNVKNGQKVRLEINNLTSEELDKKTVRNITLKLYNKIKAEKGTDSVVYREVDGVSKSVNRQLYGTISKLGSRYALNIKIVDGEKGSVVFGKVKMLDDIKNIDGVIDDLADDISDSLW